MVGGVKGGLFSDNDEGMFYLIGFQKISFSQSSLHFVEQPLEPHFKNSIFYIFNNFLKNILCCCFYFIEIFNNKKLQIQCKLCCIMFFAIFKLQLFRFLCLFKSSTKSYTRKRNENIKTELHLWVDKCGNDVIRMGYLLDFFMSKLKSGLFPYLL